MFLENLPFLPSDVCSSQEGTSCARNPTNPTLAIFDAAEFLSVLNSRGIKLTARGGKIRFDAPAGSFAPELRATAADHREELLRLLASGPQDLRPQDSGQDHGDGDAAEISKSAPEISREKNGAGNFEKLAQESKGSGGGLPGWTLPPWPPPVPAEIIADPRPICGDCGRVPVVPGQPGRQAGLCFGCWIRTQKGRQDHDCDS